MFLAYDTDFDRKGPRYWSQAMKCDLVDMNPWTELPDLTTMIAVLEDELKTTREQTSDLYTLSL